MGYSLDSAGRLCCDRCGTSGGVRKRTCPHRVLGDTLHSATRQSLPWCPAPALCAGCFSVLGGTAQLHAHCAEGAARAQAEYDANEAALDAGELFVTSAYGSWHESVPEGWTGLHMRGRNESRAVLVRASEYTGSGFKLSDASEWIEWKNAA